MSDESTLRSYGYSVRKDGPSEKDRHDILIKILKDGLLNKTEIIQHIEMLLSYNGLKENMKKAVFKWQRDLEFVRNYELELHDELIIDNIEVYRN